MSSGAGAGVGPAPKRSRSTGKWDREGLDAKGRIKRKAIIAQIRERSKWPRAQYGVAHYLRGTPDNIERWGATWKQANAEQRALRAQFGYTGRGLYTGSGRYNLLKSSGRFTRGLGNVALSRLSGGGLYTGSGMYTNNLISGAGTSIGSVPSFTGGGDETGSFVVSHSEYLTDIYAPGVANSGVATPFSLQAFALNPGLQTSFTFLSQIAQNYEEYQFIQLVYNYRSTTTDIGNSTTGQCGTVIMACNYNANNPSFVDKQSMMEYAHAASAKVTEDLAFGVECDPAKSAAGSTALYIRSNPVAVGQDLKTYDIGLFQVALANVPPAYNGLPIGELWVTYKVMLRKPKLFASRGLDTDGDLIAGQQSLAYATMLGTGTLRAQQSNIGCAFYNGLPPGDALANYYYFNSAGSYVAVPAVANISIVFPANYTGNVRVTLKLSGTAMTYTNNAWAAKANATGLISGQSGIIPTLTVYNTATPSCQGTPSATATYLETYCDLWVQASTNGRDNTLLYTGITAATSVTSCIVSVFQYPTLAGNVNFNSQNPRIQFVNANGTVVIPV